MDYNITYRQKDKTLQCIISYKDNLGKWKQKSKQGFKTQKDSKVWINKTVEELEGKIKLAATVDPLLIGMTFKELINNFTTHKEIHREHSTILTIGTAHNKFTSLDDIKVTDITKANIQNCVDMMVKEGLAIGTIRSYLPRMRTVFNYAIDKLEIIEKNPCDNPTIPADKKDNQKIKALTKSQLTNLFDKIEQPNYKLITMIAGTCGLRIGEIMGLTWDDIDFKKSTLSINKQWKVIKGWEYGFGVVKRKKSNRIVPIPKKTLDELKIYKSLYPIHTTKRILYSRINNSNISSDLSKTYKKLGYNVTVHDLRHTYATYLLSNGLDFKTVAQLMGHDVQETINTYSHVTDDMMERATKTINNIF